TDQSQVRPEQPVPRESEHHAGSMSANVKAKFPAVITAGNFASLPGSAFCQGYIAARHLEIRAVILSAAKDLARLPKRSKARAQDDSQDPSHVRSREAYLQMSTSQRRPLTTRRCVLSSKHETETSLPL